MACSLAVGCGDDSDNGDKPVATATQVAEPNGTPTEPLSSELPSDVVDAVAEYVGAGSIPSFPVATELKLPADCTTAGDVCYNPDASSFDETTATVRVYPYASDDIQNVQVEVHDGEWAVVSYGTPTE